ncbi:hypothetical protein Tco_0145182 [Tanacetum coccineum]
MSQFLMSFDEERQQVPDLVARYDSGGCQRRNVAGEDDCTVAPNTLTKKYVGPISLGISAGELFAIEALTPINFPSDIFAGEMLHGVSSMAKQLTQRYSQRKSRPHVIFSLGNWCCHGVRRIFPSDMSLGGKV